jgi:regulator of extracellular matrix RemA (YlzA/DUF370 family)
MTLEMKKRGDGLELVHISDGKIIERHRLVSIESPECEPNGSLTITLTFSNGSSIVITEDNYINSAD